MKADQAKAKQFIKEVLGCEAQDYMKVDCHGYLSYFLPKVNRSGFRKQVRNLTKFLAGWERGPEMVDGIGEISVMFKGPDNRRVSLSWWDGRGETLISFSEYQPD
jgi:hypothetical protein